jgi:N-acetylglutamate synthase-like GNAT family acetyltransferase
VFYFALKLPHDFQNANPTTQPAMNTLALRIRRATVDDRETLKNLWASMRLSPDDLEKRLTEFQVVETSNGTVVGAIGIQFSGSHALLHSEAYSDFGVADTARQLLWERIQTLAANHGAFRVWTQEHSPFWKNFGFQPPNTETLTRLPSEWKDRFDGSLGAPERGEGDWLTLPLKNEELINATLEKEFAQFIAAEKKDTARVSQKARTINTVITVIGFAIGISSIGFAIYLFVHRNPFSQH